MRDALRGHLRSPLPRMPALIPLDIGLAYAAPRLVWLAAAGAMAPLAELMGEAKPTGGKAPNRWRCI